MDLISCRNVLIYLDSMQERVFSRFHFALNPGGFLLLGRSETAVSSPDLFAPVDREARLYVRQEVARRPATAQSTRRKVPPMRELAAAAERPPRKADVRQQADRVVVHRYGPPRMIVNRNLETVVSSGETTSFRRPDPSFRTREYWTWWGRLMRRRWKMRSGRPATQANRSGSSGWGLGKALPAAR